MTLAKIIAEVDELKPNQFSDGLKIQWLSRLESKIYNDIIFTHEPDKKKKTDSEKSDDIESIIPDDFMMDDTEEAEEIVVNEKTKEEEAEEVVFSFGGYTEDDLDTEVVVPDTYADLYKYYVFAMIDFACGETARYTNSMLMYNAAYADFANWYNRTHKPKNVAYRY